MTFQTSNRNAAGQRPSAPGRGLDRLPGMALVNLIASVAFGIERAAMGIARSTNPVIEEMLIAILIGMLLRNTLGQPATAASGVAFAGAQLFECAVLVLGASVNFAQLFQTGPRLLLLIVLCVGAPILVCSTVGRLLGPNAKLVGHSDPEIEPKSGRRRAEFGARRR